MTSFDTSSGLGRQTGTSRALINDRKALNRNTMFALIVVLALVPLPFGAVHGFTWGVFAVLVGLMCVFYTLRIAVAGVDLPVPMTQMRVAIVLFVVYCGFLLFQVIPMGFLPALTNFDANGIVFPSSTISVAADQTVLMVMRQLTFGALFLLVVQVTQNPSRRDFFLNALLAIITLYCIQGLVSLQTGDTVLGVPKYTHIGSATGPFVDRNSFATFLAMGAVIALVQVGRNIVRQSERHPHDGPVAGAKSNATLYGVAYLVLVGVVFATNSRMGVFCTIAGSAVVIAVVASRLTNSFTTMAVMLAVVVVSASLALVLFGDALLTRLFDLENSALNRAELYVQTMELISRRPWLGWGGGAYEAAFQIVHQIPVSPDYRFEKAHNTYLSLWSEMGLVMGSLPILLFILVGVRLIGALRRQQPNWAYQAVGLAVLTIGFFHSLVEFSLEIQANTMFFVTLVALALGTTFRTKA